LLLALMFIVVVGVAIFTYTSYRSAATEVVLERDRQLAYLSAGRLREELNNFAEVLLAVARTPVIADGTVNDFEYGLNRSSLRLSVFDGGVVVLDNFGQVVTTEPRRAEIHGDDWSGYDFFIDLLAAPAPHYSNAVPVGHNGEDVVVISVPIIGKEGEFNGALLGMFRLGQETVSPFYANIVRLRLGQSGDTYVVDGNGRLLYASDERATNASLDASEIYGLSPEVGAAAVRTQDAAGHDIVAAVAPVPSTPWSLITEDDWAALTGPVQGYTRILLAAVAVGTILPAFGVFYLLRTRSNEMLDRVQRAQWRQTQNQLQRRILPRHVPVLTGWEAEVHAKGGPGPVGYFYDFMILADGRLLVSLGRLGLIGLPNAIHGATLRATLRGAILNGHDPASALQCANRLLCQDLPPGASVSCLVGILDPETGTLSFASAGNPTPRVGGRSRQQVADGAGQALGVTLDAEYQMGEVTLQPGESLFLFGQNLLAATNFQGETFGIERLQTILERPLQGREAFLTELLETVRAFTGNGFFPAEYIVIAFDRVDDSPALLPHQGVRQVGAPGRARRQLPRVRVDDAAREEEFD
jgi:hypothetical protein